MRNPTCLTQSVGILLVAAAVVLPARAADAQDRSGGGREAVQRWPGPQDSRPAPRANGPEARGNQPQRRDDGDDRVFAQRQAQPRGGRPQGGNPRTGTAVPRGAGQPAPRAGGRTVYVQPRPGNRYYFNGPRAYAYPYAFGAMGWGLGYYYNDPYAWYPGDPWRYGYAAPGYGYAYQGGAYGYDVGRLRLQVQPRHAEVYIDGYYAGIVDDFDGRFQGMSLESGGYGVEIALPGFEPLQFDIRITPGRTTTYRGELLPKRP